MPLSHGRGHRRDRHDPEMQSAPGQVAPTIYPGGKVAAFDGLRAVAVALVVIHHLLPHNVVGGGVEIFLVLSGYLITTILLNEHHRSGTIDYGRFLYRRLLRLYPALIVVTVVAAIALCAVGLAGFALRQAAYALTYTFDFALSIAHVAIGPLGHTWSLSIEMLFYLAVPLVVLLLTRLPARLRLVAMAVLAGAGVAGQVVFFAGFDNFGPQSRLGALLVGCLLAVGLDQYQRRLSPVWLVAAGAVFVVLTVLVDGTGTLGQVWVNPSASVLTAIAVWVLATVHDEHVGPLANPAVVHVGVLSYAIYLWHYPIIFFLHRAHLGAVWIAVIAVPASLLLAELSRRYVENPFLRLKDRRPVVAPALAHVE